MKRIAIVLFVVSCNSQKTPPPVAYCDDLDKDLDTCQLTLEKCGSGCKPVREAWVINYTQVSTGTQDLRITSNPNGCSNAKEYMDQHPDVFLFRSCQRL